MTARPTRDAGDDRPDGWAAPGKRLVDSALADAAAVPPLDQLGRVHIIGIAGAGTSALARLLQGRGVTVDGCEARMSAGVTALRQLGIPVEIGHSAAHIARADTVVFNTALAPDHLEIVAAHDSGKPLLRRAAALASVIGAQTTLAVAGTHGKTTTSSLLVVGLQACGADPSFALGGTLYEGGANAHLGTGPLFVVEADESDGSFLLLTPSAAIVTNVEADHLENHGDLEGIHRAFRHFVDRMTPDALLLVDVDDAGARRVAEYARSTGRQVLGYGSTLDADVRMVEVEQLPDRTKFVVEGLDTVAPDIAVIVADDTDGALTIDDHTVASGNAPTRLPVEVAALVGVHMARNATGALAIAARFGLDVATMASAWSAFQGVRRRFELRGVAGEVRVYDDYAHHPTEVAAQLVAAHAVTAATGGRLIGVFQPGTYSRTQTFATEFGEAMAHADVAVVLDIFAARELPIPGVTGAMIAERIPLPPEQVVYEPSFDHAAGRIVAIARPGDVVVTMGIGNVHMLCPEILRLLTAPAADPGPAFTGAADPGLPPDGKEPTT